MRGPSDGGARPRLWVGWREWVALPGLGVERIKAKVDTGARTSALHAIHIRRYWEDGVERVAFEIHPLQRRADITVRCVADVVTERVVTSSTGHRERRLVIRTPLLIAGRRWSIKLTLTNRDSMGFRMLLGRRAMLGRLLVDPGASYLAGAADSDRAGSTRRHRSR
ncbi:MAG TPA: RimK/LysX family protein [Nitrococcus sp.]|nr:RimK/LysX family protein [Nitrococcus sp.]